MPSPIIYLPFKLPVRYDLVQPLANWLDDEESQVGFDNNKSSSYSYSEVDAAPAMVIPKPSYNSVQCRSELLRIAALRNCMSEALQDSHKSAIEEHEMLRDCQDYHATLLEFEKRGFPTGGGGDSDEDNGINLTWKDAFTDETTGSQRAGGSSGAPETHHTLLWDRACTLWNIAALRSAAAALKIDDKPTKEELREAISNLQHAASHLSLCRQILEHSRENEYISTVDLSRPMLQFWEKVMLAQAQSCIYKMANLGGSSVRNHSTLAYLIQGAAPLYNEALTLAQDPRLQSELPTRCQEWAAHCKAQSLLCQARAYFHISIDLRLAQTHGKEIGRLRQTVTALNGVLDFCRSTQVLKEALDLFGGRSRKGGSQTISPIAEAAATIQPEAEGLLRLASDRLKAAEEDNQTVYMEDVPKPNDLPEIRAQTMVKTDLPLPEAMLTSRANLFTWE